MAQLPVQNFNRDLANLGEILGENLAAEILAAEILAYLGVNLAEVRISAAKFLPSLKYGASRELYVSFLCKLDTMHTIVKFTFFAHLSVSSRPQKSKTFLLNSIKLFLIKQKKTMYLP